MTNEQFEKYIQKAKDGELKQLLKPSSYFFY